MGDTKVFESRANGVSVKLSTSKLVVLILLIPYSPDAHIYPSLPTVSVYTRAALNSPGCFTLYLKCLISRLFLSNTSKPLLVVLTHSFPCLSKHRVCNSSCSNKGSPVLVL